MALNSKSQIGNLKRRLLFVDRAFSQARGFTLVELIVSIGLFTVVMTISIGALLTVTDASGKAQANRIVMDNLNLAVESIARGMRVGSDYHCGTGTPLTSPLDCSGGSAFITYRDSSSGNTVGIRLKGGRIERTTNCGADSCSGWLALTAGSIQVDDLSFSVDGAAAGDGKQPLVLIIIRGVAGVKDKEKAPFNIQTTVSQRFLDT